MAARKRGTCTSASDSQSSSQASARAFFGGILGAAVGLAAVARRSKRAARCREADWGQRDVGSTVMMSLPANIAKAPPGTPVCSGS